ncbi:unnamed protein product [Paramecium pentaurelia]|uniref:PHD-type domain-containing protein n=1 Tax=Paramecium pentaurelia TaxID=43138 RepID=A0A8S1W1T8_9CILI|nr:unnamed protein product [Paramecium pentaurelia]
MNDLNIYNILNYENYDQLVQLFNENGACQFYSSIFLHSLDITLYKEEPIKYLNKKNQNQFGIIKEIVCLNLKNKNQLPLIKIQVLLTTQFVSQYVNTKIADWLESRELFSCQDTQWICWSDIQGKIILVKHDEIPSYANKKQMVYFMRASFNHYTKQFNPPYDQWQRQYCVCGNPDNHEKRYVQCDICDIWYHMECEGLTQQQCDRLDKNKRLTYSCNSCKIGKKKKR